MLGQGGLFRSGALRCAPQKEKGGHLALPPLGV